jgi:hypothetical protein
MKKYSGLFAVILAFVMCLSILPVSAAAEPRIVGASIRSNESDVVINNPASYIVSLEKATGVGEFEVRFTFDGFVLDRNSITATPLNGFTSGINPGLSFQYLGQDMWEGYVKYMYLEADRFVDSDSPLDVLKISGTAISTGRAKVALTSFSAWGDTGEGLGKMQSFIDKADATTNIGLKPPVYSKYDLNKDGVVDELDLLYLIYFYQWTDRDPGWDTEDLYGVFAKDCDFQVNGRIDLADMIELIANYTKDGITSVVVSPAAVSDMELGTSQQFSAVVNWFTPGGSQNVMWSVSGAESVRTYINANGLLIVSSDETSRQLIVTATPEAFGFSHLTGSAVVNLRIAPTPNSAVLSLSNQSLEVSLQSLAGHADSEVFVYFSDAPDAIPLRFNVSSASSVIDLSSYILARNVFVSYKMKGAVESDKIESQLKNEGIPFDIYVLLNPELKLYNVMTDGILDSFEYVRINAIEATAYVAEKAAGSWGHTELPFYRVILAFQPEDIIGSILPELRVTYNVTGGTGYNRTALVLISLAPSP